MDEPSSSYGVDLHLHQNYWKLCITCENWGGDPTEREDGFCLMDGLRASYDYSCIFWSSYNWDAALESILLEATPTDAELHEIDLKEIVAQEILRGTSQVP